MRTFVKARLWSGPVMSWRQVGLRRIRVSASSRSNAAMRPMAFTWPDSRHRSWARTTRQRQSVQGYEAGVVDFGMNTPDHLAQKARNTGWYDRVYGPQGWCS